MTAWNESNLKYFDFIALFTHLSISCNTSTLYHISYIAELPIFSTRFYSILLSLYFVQVSNFILLGGHNGTFDFSITPIIKDFYCEFPYFQMPWYFFFFFFAPQGWNQATTCMDFYHAILSTSADCSKCKEMQRVLWNLILFKIFLI